MTDAVSYRNQSIDLLGKSMDWFLYDNGLRHERVNVRKTSERSSYFSKVAGLFLANFAKVNTVTGIFQRFYLGFKQFSFFFLSNRMKYFQKTFQWQIQ